MLKCNPSERYNIKKIRNELDKLLNSNLAVDSEKQAICEIKEEKIDNNKSSEQISTQEEKEEKFELPEEFIFIKKLGAGSCGTALLVKEKKTGKEMVYKFQQNELDEYTIDELPNNMLARNIIHPNIVSFSHAMGEGRPRIHYFLHKINEVQNLIKIKH